MKIEIKNEDFKQKKQVRLNSEAILNYLIANNEKIDTMIMCKEPEVEIVATDKDVYEALGSLRSYDNFKINKLTKFFENVEVCSFKEKTGNEKGILTFEKAEELRRSALKQTK